MISAVLSVGLVVPTLTVKSDWAVKESGLVTCPVQVRSTPATEDVQLPPTPPIAAPPPMMSPIAKAETKQAGGANLGGRR
jgi:hypothetical protein